MNWYVVQVKNGHEKETANKCCFLISKDILKECFIPEYITKKKYQGEWKDKQEVLFKGYIFLISDHIDELYSELKKIPDYTKVIGKKKEEIYPLHSGEIEFLKSFENDKHVVEMSIGFIEGDTIFITEGPLQGKEGLITKIDRHKRIANISIDIFGKITTAKVGLEIVSKN